MIQAKKSFGQHFLINTGVIERMVRIVHSLAGFTRKVIEIGPGRGALTGPLLEAGLKVMAIEVDPDMQDELKKRFADQIKTGALEILSCDVLSLNLAVLGRASESYVVCGNLPYNIGTEIVFRFLEQFPAAAFFCFMLQKEVVLRFLSGGDDADFGMPSLKMAWSTRLLGQFWVKAGSFQPPPKVESGVFWFERLKGPELLADPLQRGALFDQSAAFASKFFQHRRKMLRAIDPRLKDTPWAELRPQNISPKDWIQLALKYTITS